MSDLAPLPTSVCAGGTLYTGPCHLTCRALKFGSGGVVVELIATVPIFLTPKLLDTWGVPGAGSHSFKDRIWAVV